MNHYKISVLLPTRGRTDTLHRSISSLIDQSKSVDNFELRFGFDNDDGVGIEYFKNTVQPYLDSKQIAYTAMLFEPLGYGKLNEYVNHLAHNTNSDWFFFWNDDAVMVSKDWDQVIIDKTGDFKLLSVHTHNEHPYSIFPIVPRDWYQTLGHLSQHQMNDAWLTQIAYKLDVFERVGIWVEHDRSDLTGNNNDNTYKARVMYEGNPKDPKDFHNIDVIRARIEEVEKLAAYMRSRGINTDFWERVKLNKQDPWEKLKANDVNRQMMQFTISSDGAMVPGPPKLYDFNYYVKADGIMSWKSKSLKFGDSLAALAYAHGIAWQDLVSHYKAVFDVDPNGRGESTTASLVHEQMHFLKNKAVRHPKRVLEIGGGRGEVATVLRYLGIDVVSVEVGREAEKWYAATAMHFFGSEFPPVKPIVEPIQNLVGTLDFASFDTILMIESLEHIPADAFEPVWQQIHTKFKGRFVITNWPDYHPIWIGRDAGPEEHCRLVDDTLYNHWSSHAKSVFARHGSHLVLDF